jgi:DNA-binding FadR family transcriptional regulator
MIDDNTDQRVIEDVRTAARALPPGSRLPSVRELMARHRASPVTVQRAITRLAQEGLVVPRPGRGTFVAPRAAGLDADEPPDLSWQAVALGAPRGDGASLSALLELPPPGAIALSTG